MALRTLQEHFEPTVESVAAARHLVARFLTEEPQAVRETIELGVSELATNAVRHARTGYEVEVRVVDRHIRVQVADESRSEPAMQALSNLERHGRGLQIVRGISDRFGVDWKPGHGKAIWFELLG